MIKLSFLRKINLFGFLCCLFLLIAAGYMQLALGLKPCPLCIVQRVIVFIVGLCFLAGALHTPKRDWVKLSGFIIFLIASLGIAVAGRQIWLQTLPPDQVPPCGPDLSYMLQTLPFTQTLQWLLQGSGDCAKDIWHFFYLTIPEWTLLFFILFALLGLWQLFKKSWT